MLRTLEQQVTEALGRLLDAFVSVIPAVLVLVVALVLGILVGVVIRAVLRMLLRLRSRRGAAPASAAGSLLRAAGVKAEPEQLAGTISFWSAVVVSLAVGVNALEPSLLRSALTGVVSFLPNLLTAAFLFVVGLGLAALARMSVLIAAVNAGLPWARPGSRGVHAIIVASFAAAALEHLGVGRSVLVAAFSIVGGGIVLALALAFGLGARDLAKGYLERKLRAEEEDTGIRHV